MSDTTTRRHTSDITVDLSTASATLREQILNNHGTVAGAGAQAAGRVVPVVDATAATRHFSPAAFTDLGAGRVGVLARPGMRRLGWLAADTLAALGCRNDVTGSGQPGDGDWALATAWLKTHRIRHLYIQHAWTMPFRVLEDLHTVLAHTELTLWLVGDSPYTDTHSAVLDELVTASSDAPSDAPTDTRTRHFAGAVTAPITGEEFIAAWADTSALRVLPLDCGQGELVASLVAPPATSVDGRTAAAVEMPGQAGWPIRVPDDDFTTFRAACRAVLSEAQFTLVDDAFQANVTTVADALAALAGAGPVDEASVAALLAHAWQDAESMAHFITYVRAAQVAFFLAHYYLQVDLDQLIGTAATMPRRAARTSATWARLLAYPEPHRGAVCALAAAGMPVGEIRRLTVDHVDPVTGDLRPTLATSASGSTCGFSGTPDDRTVDVEAAAQVFLRAQAHLRHIQGATGADPLFVTKHGRARNVLTENALVAVITKARQELGVAVAPARLDRKAITSSRWLTRWGVSIQELL